MTTIHITTTTPVAPEHISAALTDFTPRRVEFWPNIDPKYYQVHAVQATSADVTEGSAFLGGVWERVRYDWSQPGRILIRVQDSNAFTSDSSWDYRISPRVDGGSQVELTLHRVGKTIKGKIVATMLRIFGKRIFLQDLQQTLKRLEQTSIAFSSTRQVD